jgi:type II secretory pathway pseudopilin PulG
MEMLLVVAIIAILGAIAIPSIANLNTNLKMLKADSYAKEIYYAAQNRLASMDATGELGQLVLSDDDKVTVEPADYAENAGSDSDTGWESLYRLDSDGADDSTIVSEVMDAASVTDGMVTEGNYVIEFSPSSGEVYSVFYSEKTDLTYGDIQVLDQESGGRSKANRTAGLIGYYSGGSITLVGTPIKLAPTVTLVNAEELYAHITCDCSSLPVSTSNPLVVTLTLTDKQTGGTWTKDLSTTSLVGGELDEDVLLDSMQTGESFAQITGGTIASGDDVTATVTVRYKNKGTTGTATSNTENSLYQSLDIKDGVLTAKVANVRQLDNLRDGTCTSSKGSFTKAVQTSDIDFDATTWSADMSGNAPLSAGTIAWNKANVTNCPDTGYVNPLGAGTADGGGDGFTPITDTATGWSYDGQGNLIKDFDIVGGSTTSSSSTGTGLFGTMSGSISNTFLVNPVVTGGTYTGALVGLMKGSAVTNCGVYLEPDTSGNYDTVTVQCTVTAVDGSACVGGLVGDCEGATVKQCFAAIDVLPVTKASGTGSIIQVGGLIGKFLTAGGSSVSNSYASGDVTASSVAGGLIGEMTGTTRSAWSWSWDTDSAISNCYSTSDVTADTHAGGFVGMSLYTWPTISGSASYGEVTTASGDLDLWSSGGFIGSGDNQFGLGGADIEDCSYLCQIDYNEDYYNWYSSGLTAKSYDAMVNDASPIVSAANSHPYDSTLSGKTFPFTSVLSNHYGDWPTKTDVKPTLVYYEKYKHTDGTVTYGYYANTSISGQSDLGTLKLDTLETGDTMAARGDSIVEDGYALMTSYAVGDDEISYSSTSGATGAFYVSDTAGYNNLVPLTTDPVSLTLTSSTNKTVILGQAYIYQLPFNLQEPNRTSSSSFYDTLTIRVSSDYATQTSYTYYYCGEFAETAINPNANGSTTKPTAGSLTVLVRSARQLNALGQYPFYWNTSNSNGWTFHFVQGCDISFSDYVTTYCGESFDLMDTSGDYCNEPIGTVGNLFSFDYSGGISSVRDYNHDGRNDPGYEIKNYCLESTNQFVGLFGETYNNTISNVRMVSTDDTDPASVISTYSSTISSKTGSVGALVGLLYIDKSHLVTTVSNCSVEGYLVEFTNDGVTSGSSYNASAGGLVGYNMGVVSGCSANDRLISITEYNNQTSLLESIGGLVGSNAGTITASTVLSTHVPANTSQLQCNVIASSKKSLVTVSFGGIAGRYYAQSSNTTLIASISGCTSKCIIASGAAQIGGVGSVEYYGIANWATANTGKTDIGNTAALKSYTINQTTNAFARALIFTKASDDNLGNL